MLSSVAYKWSSGSRISAMIDAEKGPTEYTHDVRDRLIAAKYPDGTEQYRTTDRVGNLYKSKDRSDREYLRGGMIKRVGDVKYTYDQDGQLTEKRLADGSKWQYQWNDAGKLVAVKRPDKEVIEFAYDAFSRRVRKKSKGKDTRFVWDGHTTLHEVVNKKDVITWVFEPESFTPLLKVENNKRYGLATDHLGTPTELVDERGNIAWKAQLDVYGVLHTDVAAVDCPWRWPGQYEDQETSCNYNRYRHYAPDIAAYISADPLRLYYREHINGYGYPDNPTQATDPLGLIIIFHYTGEKGFVGIQHTGPAGTWKFVATQPPNAEAHPFGAYFSSRIRPHETSEFHRLGIPTDRHTHYFAIEVSDHVFRQLILPIPGGRGKDGVAIYSPVDLVVYRILQNEWENRRNRTKRTMRQVGCGRTGG